ncbi:MULTISPECIES: FMN-binding negative transcriptional regulator [unclassified Ruegeria]|uniref:FMN-binding negative transcriptional regulator n=1 Tax=unclassified Ruegeria TaxID=2625375 RepID=UPI001492E6FF|nr:MULTISPECIES: FMN-binding negative transcriptional regulator [unclassified Ruegeria]NOD90155.1 FMN-binding negative transcriptional regulator [Ruegeria sp. HKCCD4318]NOE15228.1 FMN-binding negative transcriptional regulator [Ruegeria sp. HKCCD4318-2]NOG10562.1 FMN-binding negative transcriptional regulator [Ruegeria sp. HKCCD4315]
MHPNPAFRADDRTRHIAYARERGFGVLALSTDGAPLLSHVPFLLSEDGLVAELHLVRSNPIVRALGTPKAMKIAVQGPDGYISPDWYEVEDQVPTWNYVAVHLTGQLELRPQEELLDLLNRQSAFYEERLQPKPPWDTAKMSDEALTKMMRMIVPCRIQVEDVQGTWKLSQNKPDDVRLRASEQVASSGIGSELSVLQELMRNA